jgi:hypothetical protein
MSSSTCNDDRRYGTAVDGCDASSLTVPFHHDDDDDAPNGMVHTTFSLGVQPSTDEETNKTPETSPTHSNT